MKGCYALSPEQITAWIGGFHGCFAARNRAMVLLGLTTGARISELLALNVYDVLDDAGEFRADIVFRKRHRKRKQESRRQPLYAVAREALEPWLSELRHRGGVWRWTPLFATRSLKRMSRGEAYKALRAGMERAGLALACMGTHTMRKTFARAALNDLIQRRANGEAVEPLLELQRLLGHRDISSTISYTETLGAGRETMDRWACTVGKLVQNYNTGNSGV